MDTFDAGKKALIGAFLLRKKLAVENAKNQELRRLCDSKKASMHA